MYFTAQINSFVTDGKLSLPEIFEKLSKIDGLTHIDLDYPEHFKDICVEKMEVLLQNNNH